MSGSTFVNRSAQEHLLYIQEKVNPILEALVTAVLLERPEDPSLFMLKWLCEQTKTIDGADQGQRSSSTSEEIESAQAEIDKLRERKAELLAAKGKKQESKETKESKVDAKSDKSTKADEDEEEEEEDDDDDDVDLEAMPPPKMNRGPRQSVSAEAYGVWNQKKDFVAPEYPKTPEQQERIAKCLEPSFLFHALDQDEMKTVVLALKEKQVDGGVRVIQQGDDGEEMFLIEQGSVDCLKKSQGEEKVVKTCTAGDVFGELALLYNCPRAASVITKEKTTLWELERETFNRIVKDAAAKKRTTYTDFLKNIPLFSSIDDYSMMTIADAVKVENYDSENHRVIKQGDVGDTFFVILEGECIAKKAFVVGQDEQTVMVHHVGDYFGELSIIKNEPRAASVYTSKPHVKLLSMERKTFKRLLGSIESILRQESKRYN